LPGRALDYGPPICASCIAGITRLAPPCSACWLRWDFTKFLPGLTLKCNPPDFCLQRIWDYRCEPLLLAILNCVCDHCFRLFVTLVSTKQTCTFIMSAGFKSGKEPIAQSTWPSSGFVNHQPSNFPILVWMVCHLGGLTPSNFLAD
jgi:hypothetical protein